MGTWGEAMRTLKSAARMHLCALLGFVFLSVPLAAFAASWVQVDPGAYKAFKTGNLKVVKKILKANNYYKYTPEQDEDPPVRMQALHLAVESGNMELVKYLDRLGWVDECRKRNDCRLILAAAQEGRIEMIKILMSRGFDVKFVSRGGATALFEAARGGQFETVKFLCDQGVDPNVKIRNRTALEFARIAYQGGGQLHPDPEEAMRRRAGLPKVIEYLESGRCKKK